jgi:UDP-N-acetylglucosamine pyrophosphorylase
VFNTRWLFEKLGELNTNNAQQEYYLTDLFSICFKTDKKVCAYKTATPNEILGINTPAQLQQIEEILKKGGVV